MKSVLCVTSHTHTYQCRMDAEFSQILNNAKLSANAQSTRGDLRAMNSELDKHVLNPQLQVQSTINSADEASKVPCAFAMMNHPLTHSLFLRGLFGVIWMPHCWNSLIRLNTSLEIWAREEFYTCMLSRHCARTVPPGSKCCSFVSDKIACREGLGK